MLPKGAIFDLDGTLLDSMWVWEYVDITFQKVLNFSVRDDYYEQISSMSPTQSAVYTISEYGLDITPDKLKSLWFNIAKDAYINKVDIKPGADMFLKKLYQSGVKLAIATSCFPELCKETLKANGIEAYFSAFCYSEDLGEGKETGKIYLQAAKNLQVEPSGCAVFEDILAPLNSVKKLGMEYLAVYDKNQPVQTQEELKKGADDFFEDYNQILNKNKFGRFSFEKE